MNTVLFFIGNSALLGVGLAMDAFSVSLANGLNENRMSIRKTLGIAGVFAFFQFLMPMIGWGCVRFLMRIFRFLESLIPWIALVLLVFIGVRMILEGVRHKGEDEKREGLGIIALLLQGVATSIDALSVGLATAEYSVYDALLAAFIIGLVTFVICLFGVVAGKRFGTRIAGSASVLGGIILILIGIEIFIKGLFA